MTLLVAMMSSILIFCLSPVRALILYIAMVAWYPSYLSVQIGTLDFTACRIIMITLYVRLFLLTNLPKRFNFIWLDKIIILFFVAQVAAGMTTTPALQLLENRAGAIFDMVLPYFAIRLIVKSKEQYLILLKGVLLCSAPLAILGLYQCLTGNNIFSFIPGHVYALKNIPRHGFYRATLTFSVSIMFGLYFAILGPICAGLWPSIKRRKSLYIAAILLMGIGVFSSMSSGPWLATLVAIAFILFYRFRRYWKTCIVFFFVLCAMVEVVSNRHFYEVIDRFTLSSKTAWYRSRLMEVALFEDGMSGHWLTGYGLVDPGWSHKIDHRDHTDMVNHYLLVLSRFGLLALIPFFTIIISAFYITVKCFRFSMSDYDKWLIWCLSGALVGLLVSLFSVSLFGPPKTVLYLLFGFFGVMPAVVRETNLRFSKAFEKSSELSSHTYLGSPQLELDNLL